MSEEVKNMEKAKDTMESAVSKSRKAAGNLEEEKHRDEAEKDFQKQVDMIKEKLEKFFENHVKSLFYFFKFFLEQIAFGYFEKIS